MELTVYIGPEGGFEERKRHLCSGSVTGDSSIVDEEIDASIFFHDGENSIRYGLRRANVQKHMLIERKMAQRSS